jgi:hypothetical protein
MDKRVAAHACVTCKALPVDQQPKKPRPAPYGGPRSKRCKTHELERKRAKKTGARTAHVERQFGLSRQDQQDLWEYQGGRCACGKPMSKPHLDHDHNCCPESPTCGKCCRGYLCYDCNVILVGRYSETRLRAVADYIADPFMARLRRQRND